MASDAATECILMAASGQSLSEGIKCLAEAMGFDRVGVTAAQTGQDAQHFRDWLARGFAGSMAYLERRTEDRADPGRLLEGVQSVIAVGLVYAEPEEVGSGGQRASVREASGRVARYAQGDDYHELMLDRLRALQQGIEALAGRPVRCRPYVDTGPVLERAFAARAGLGWIGKNTCLISPELGSYLFLGVLFTELALEGDEPVSDHCGSCRACLEVCPTDAFVAPYVLDARRCIAYSTIEETGPGDASLRAERGDHVFGCDLCQEVCPWNRKRGRSQLPDPLGLRERMQPRAEWAEPALAWLLELDEEGWRALTRRSPLRRTGYRALLRNALVAAGNSDAPELIPLLQRFAEHEDATLAESARWALKRLNET